METKKLTKKELPIRIRYNKDIGVHTLDRSIADSCKHKSEFCKKHCYNNKMYKVFKQMYPADTKNEYYWQSADIANDIKKYFARRKDKIMRLASRGEIFSELSDIHKVRTIAQTNKDIIFHIPTRAWISPSLRPIIQALFDENPNLRIFASIDPSYTDKELKIASKFCSGTMFFGDNEKHPYENRFIKCKKTWNNIHKNGCNLCRLCYNTKKTNIHIWLKKH